MSTILLLIFIFFVVIPICRIGWHIWRAMNSFNRTHGHMHDAFDQAAQGFGPFGPFGPQPQPQPQRSRKKIDPEVGEYVKFEEIKTAASAEATSSPGGTTIHAEEQIEDAVWEEIK